MQGIVDSSDVRKYNVNLIRAAMWKGGQHTKQSIAMTTGLSQATCNTLLNELERNGEVLSSKQQLRDVGRSTGIYRINEAYESILCVRLDVLSNGDRMLMCDVLSMLGTSLFQEYSNFDRLTAPSIVEKIAVLVQQFSNISSILIGVCGVIDHGVIRMSDIPELDGVELLMMVRKVTQNIPIHMAYDCQYRAYGIYKDAGYLQETLSLVFCARNILPGTASVVGGRVIQGKNGFAGMTGYMMTGLSREELIRRIADGSDRVQLLASEVVAVISVLNPDEVVFAGNIIDTAIAEDIRLECEKHIPPIVMPGFRIVEARGDQHYLEGMYQTCLEMKINPSIANELHK